MDREKKLKGEKLLEECRELLEKARREDRDSAALRDLEIVTKMLEEQLESPD